MFLSIPTISGHHPAARNSNRMDELEEALRSMDGHIAALRNRLGEVRADIDGNSSELLDDMDTMRGPSNLTQHFATVADDLNSKMRDVEKEIIRMIALASGFEVTGQ